MLEEKNRGNEFSNRDQLKVPTKKKLKNPYRRMQVKKKNKILESLKHLAK